MRCEFGNEACTCLKQAMKCVSEKVVQYEAKAYLDTFDEDNSGDLNKKEVKAAADFAGIDYETIWDYNKRSKSTDMSREELENWREDNLPENPLSSSVFDKPN